MIGEIDNKYVIVLDGEKLNICHMDDMGGGQLFFISATERRKLPSEWAALGYFTFRIKFRPKVGEIIQFYSRDGRKLDGKLLEFDGDGGKIVIREAYGDNHTFIGKANE